MLRLNELKPAQEGIVTAIQGGLGFRQKLALRGLTEGNRVKVLSNWGPVTVEVNKNVMALGRGMASRIIVSGGNL